MCLFIKYNYWYNKGLKNNMKKAIILTMVLSMVLVSSPAFAVTVGVGTSLIPDTTGGTNPIVQAKWEMNIQADWHWVTDPTYQAGGYYRLDDSTAAGAQFIPSGQYQVNKRISICEIVSDPDGVADVKHVYADVFYPNDIAVGPNHIKLDSQTGDIGAGCGLLMQEDELTALSKDAGIDLFCNQVRANNTNLPTLKGGYTYDTICKADGALQKEMAKVYCVEKDLSYEDPSGSYKVEAVVVDTSGKNGTLINNFTYLATTAFETDFTSIAYGKVRLETEKIINGDLSWATDDGSAGWTAGPLASVRNVGNTRAQLSVNQDDMNFGKTGLNWNVSYKARLGNMEGDWTTYNPNVSTPLKDELNLSERDEIDFSIFVKKFPVTETTYSGTMTLTASAVDHCVCGTGGISICDGVQE